MMRASVAAVLAVATPAVAEPASVVVPAGSGPALAIPVTQQVEVPVRLEIAPDGGLRCTPGQSPKRPDLRRASCALVVERGIFAPNFDRKGAAVATTLDLLVQWLPAGPGNDFGGALPISPERWITQKDYPLHDVFGGTTRVQFDVTAAGRVGKCTTVKSSNSLVLDAAVCALLKQRALFLPPLDQTGARTATTGHFSYRWPFG